MLHLWPADSLFEIPVRPAVTSLVAQHDGHGRYDHEVYAVEFRRLYTLFCILNSNSFLPGRMAILGLRLLRRFDQSQSRQGGGLEYRYYLSERYRKPW